MAALYEAPVAGPAVAALPELPVQYADFALWQRGWLPGEALAAELAYWRRAARRRAGVLDLPPTGRGRRCAATRGAGAPVRLEAGVAAALLAALGAARGGDAVHGPARRLRGPARPLQRRRRTWSLGTPVAGRNRAEIEGLIGFFVNTLVLRARPRAAHPDVPASCWTGCAEAALGAFAHQDAAVREAGRGAGAGARPSRTPLFQVMFALQNRRRPTGCELPGLAFDAARLAARHDAKFDLSLDRRRDGRRAGAAAWSYSTDLFDAPRSARLAGHLEALLAAAAAEPERPLGELPLLSAGRAPPARASGARRATSVRATPALHLHRLFAAQAARQPEAVALVAGEGRLDATASSPRGPAAWPAASRRWGSGRRCGGGSAAALAGADRRPARRSSKAGGVYLPLDPALPPERLACMLADARRGGGLHQPATRPAALPASGGRALLVLDELPRAASRAAAPTGAARAGGALPGRPGLRDLHLGLDRPAQGVVVPHARRSATCCARPPRSSGSGPASRSCSSSSLGFDASLREVFLRRSSAGASLWRWPTPRSGSTPARLAGRIAERRG